MHDATSQYTNGTHSMINFEDDQKKVIGERIRDRISSLSLKRSDVAKKAKLSEDSLRMIIKGQKYPTGYNLIHLSNALDISPTYILFGSESHKSQEAKSDNERFAEILKTSILKGRLDRDDSAVIDRLILSMLSDKLKKAEYTELMEFVDVITKAMMPLMAPLIEELGTDDVMKEVQKHYDDKEPEKEKR